MTRVARAHTWMWMVGIAVVAASACGDDDDGGGDEGGEVDAGPQPDGGVGPAEPADGEFVVLEARFGERGAGGFTWSSIEASIYDPRPVYHRLAQESGACQLWTFEVTSCGECDGLCNADGECVPLPVQLSAGTVTVDGLAEAVDLPFTETGYRLETSLPADLFGDDDAVRLEAAGGPDLPGFELTAASPPGGISIDLERGAGAEADDFLRLVDGQDLVLTWTAEPGTRVRLDILTYTRGHGLPVDAFIRCEADDTGEIAVPRVMVEAFPDHPYASACAGRDCPPSMLTRFRSDRAVVDGRDIELRVADQQQFIAVHDAL